MAEKTKKKKLSANKSKTLILLSMALPGAIWFLLLRYLPMAGVILAFSGGTSLSSNATDDTVNYTDADTSFTDMINDAKNKPEKDDDDSVTIGFSGSSGKSEVVGWVFPLKKKALQN